MFVRCVQLLKGLTHCGANNNKVFSTSNLTYLKRAISVYFEGQGSCSENDI